LEKISGSIYLGGIGGFELSFKEGLNREFGETPFIRNFLKTRGNR